MIYSADKLFDLEVVRSVLFPLAEMHKMRLDDTFIFYVAGHPTLLHSNIHSRLLACCA